MKKEKDKVYVITSGKYADYNIECIFRNKEKAEEYCSSFKDYELNDIEEFELMDE